LSQTSHPDNYFKKLQETYREYAGLTRKSLTPLEKALERIDVEAWKQLGEKARPFVIRREAERGWNQLFDLLYEAFGYEWLANHGYTSIKFVERSDKPSKRSPELFATSPTSTAVLEVKSINCSEKEIKRLAAWPPQAVNFAGQVLSEGFKRKFLHDIKNAREQLQSFEPPTDKKIAMVVIRLDIEYWLSARIYAEIEELASLQRTTDFEVVVHQLIQ